jgi:hypothetical protein
MWLGLMTSIAHYPPRMQPHRQLPINLAHSRFSPLYRLSIQPNCYCSGGTACKISVLRELNVSTRVQTASAPPADTHNTAEGLRVISPSHCVSSISCCIYTLGLLPEEKDVDQS